MRNYVTEFVGTFFLVLTVGLAVSNAGGLGSLPCASAIHSSCLRASVFNTIVRNSCSSGILDLLD